MKILGIETSCDETAAAIIEAPSHNKTFAGKRVKIISNNVVSSQIIHQKYGGIVPEVAAREQLKSIIPVLETTLLEALGQGWRKKIDEIDALAVTFGPGLIGSLLVGIETAKTLAYLWKKPIVPVNHLVGHIYANWIAPENPNYKFQNPKFPALALIVSGGHTELVLMKDHGKFQWIGGTRDDAAGESFDKTARILGLPYPGGPAISAYAEKLQINKLSNYKLSVRLPRPMMKEDNFDFSFSGLKTATMTLVKQSGKLDDLLISAICFEFQEAVCEVLAEKTLRAAKAFRVKSMLLSGGVAANKRLREKMQEVTGSQLPQAKLFIPPPRLCTDNAAYIASAACFNYHPVPWQKIQANPSLNF